MRTGLAGSRTVRARLTAGRTGRMETILATTGCRARGSSISGSGNSPQAMSMEKNGRSSCSCGGIMWTCLLMWERDQSSHAPKSANLMGYSGRSLEGYRTNKAKESFEKMGAPGTKPDCRALGRGVCGEFGRDNPPVRGTYARISFTTWPCTSVSRKSLPWKR